MQAQDRKELMRLVSAWLNEHGDAKVAEVIGDAHRARPDGWLVTTDNLHLLRQYRNEVSSVPERLIADAINWRGGLT